MNKRAKEQWRMGNEWPSKWQTVNCEERHVHRKGNEDIWVFIVRLPLPFSPITLTVEDCTARQLSEVYETITETAFSPFFFFSFIFRGWFGIKNPPPLQQFKKVKKHQHKITFFKLRWREENSQNCIGCICFIVSPIIEIHISALKLTNDCFHP